MTDHCGEGCPWSGCAGCRYQGGIDPDAPPADVTNQLVLWDNWDGKDGRPAASTADLPEPPRFDLTEQEGLPTW
jgi:hypothetical protein